MQHGAQKHPLCFPGYQGNPKHQNTARILNKRRVLEIRIEFLAAFDFFHSCQVIISIDRPSMKKHLSFEKLLLGGAFPKKFSIFVLCHCLT